MMLWKRTRFDWVTAGITRTGQETSESFRNPRQLARDSAMSAESTAPPSKVPGSPPLFAPPGPGGLAGEGAGEEVDEKPQPRRHVPLRWPDRVDTGGRRLPARQAFLEAPFLEIRPDDEV